MVMEGFIWIIILLTRLGLRFVVGKGIHPIFTPKYSSEVNMVEVVFKSLKDYMSNKIFYTIKDVKKLY
ncbi:hypothetical protein LD85_2460 [Saccharolobus islandicus L.D.8.5]|uniref:Tc1-like transposase DDE domain-containing protein n=1 Tax=Saccharolobus islandicus (strain L.D.8.5 / Lassen \|nr:hypothetical protein LD85_2460 [Sulfolobus islandicus L.D.8.5]